MGAVWVQTRDAELIGEMGIVHGKHAYSTNHKRACEGTVATSACQLERGAVHVKAYAIKILCIVSKAMFKALGLLFVDLERSREVS